MRRTAEKAPPTEAARRVEAVIAVRGGPSAKSRLADRLSPAAREALVEAMLMDVLAALARCQSVRLVHVTTPTHALADVARRSGAHVTLETTALGLNGAFKAARRRLEATRPDSVIMLLPGDLPLIEPAEVDALVEAAAAGGLALAPAVADGGTAAVALAASTPFEPAFGPESFEAHKTAAALAGLAVQVCDLPGLGLDIDRPADLDVLIARGGDLATDQLLRRLRVSGRGALFGAAA